MYASDCVCIFVKEHSWVEEAGVYLHNHHHGERFSRCQAKDKRKSGNKYSAT